MEKGACWNSKCLGLPTYHLGKGSGFLIIDRDSLENGSCVVDVQSTGLRNRGGEVDIKGSAS